MKHTSFESLLQKLQNDRSGVFFIAGLEDYYIDKFLAIGESLVPEEETDFGLVVKYGRESSTNSIIDECRGASFFSTLKVVIVRESQDLKDFEILESYFLKKNPNTILIMGYRGKLDSRKKISKIIIDQCDYFESEQIKDHKLHRWIKDYLKLNGYDIGDIESNLIAETVGNNLKYLANEFEKFFINLPKGTKITFNEIDKFIGISKEYNVFELQKNLGERNINQINKILVYLIENNKKEPLEMINGSLFGFFVKCLLVSTNLNLKDGDLAKIVKIPMFFVGDYRKYVKNYSIPQLELAVLHIHHADLQLKGLYGTIPREEILKELIANILSEI